VEENHRMELLKPGCIGNVELKNRIIMAPMGIRGLCDPDDGYWGKRVRAYYGARAAGGCGMITTEMVFVSQAVEPVAKELLDLGNDKHFQAVRQLAETVHAYNCKLSIQLTAGFGRVIPPYVVPDGVVPVSASENTNYFVPDYPALNTRALTTEEVEALAQSFGSAARRCREAGADCVELHGHEGYLMDQFMTGLWNRRTDKYGGSREKRLTFAREAIQAIKRDAGEDFPIIYRFGLTHYLEGGREEEEGIWIAQQLEALGIAALHVDAGCYETSWWPHPPQYQKPGCMVEHAAKVKAVTSIPVIAVGRLHYPEVAQQAIAEGKADFIAIGRGLLADPEWVAKVQRNAPEEIRPCIGCHEGCLWQMIAGEPTSCSLNPICGHETVWQLRPLQKKKSILIIGGGPAGIEAARAGVERGCEVTLFEASSRLGGNLWPASMPPFKKDIARYRDYLIRLAARLPIDCIFNTSVTAEDIKKFGADVVLLATGATMEPPPFDDPRVVTTVQVLNGTEPRGTKVVIMGAGVTGCEVAVYLASKGKLVTLCARQDLDELDMDMVDHNNRFMLLRMVRDAGVMVLRGTIPLRIEGNHVVAERKGVEIKIDMDSLVFAGRMFPRTTFHKELANLPGVISIGDCVKPGTIMDAVWGGFNTVRELQ